MMVKGASMYIESTVEPAPAELHREPPAPPVIEVAHLHKAYGPTVAVDDVSLTVRAGEILGILGRNGAGKTTTVECITGLRTADRGQISVLGLDPRRDRHELHERVGVQLQESAVPELMRVREAVELYASFYRHPADPRELIATLGLEDARRTYFKHLSGGQKQRLSIVLALIGQPQIAVLDELTTGLDPEARRDTWRLIEGVRARGVTTVLVTHSMEEAERLCDRVALIDHGRVIALDRPAALVTATGTVRLEDAFFALTDETTQTQTQTHANANGVTRWAPRR
jgi:ABC-2 type transport system ATP-binding protein